MTNEERKLLLMVARAVAEIEEDKATKRGATSNLAESIRELVEAIRPQN